MLSSRPDRRLVRLIAVLAVAGLAFTVASAAALPAGAHSSLIAASPGPGERVGGEVQHIDMVFSAGLADAEVTLTGPDGTAVEGVVTQKAFNWLSYEIIGLELEGQYTVRYRFLSDDGDETQSAYAFSYARDAPPPNPIVLAEPESSGRSWVFWVVAIGLLVVVAVLAGLLAERVRRLRSLP